MAETLEITPEMTYTYLVTGEFDIKLALSHPTDVACRGDESGMTYRKR